MIIAINMNAPIMLVNVIKDIRNESETVLSMVSMSLANLFMMNAREGFANIEPAKE